MMQERSEMDFNFLLLMIKYAAQLLLSRRLQPVPAEKAVKVVNAPFCFGNILSRIPDAREESDGPGG